MAIVAYGYGLDSRGRGGSRLIDQATLQLAIDEVEVEIEEQFSVVVEAPQQVAVEVPQPEVEIE